MKLKKFIACALTFATVLNGANNFSFADNENQKLENKESVEALLDSQTKDTLKSIEDLAKFCAEAKDVKVKEKIQAKIAEFETKKSYLNSIKKEAKGKGEFHKVAKIENNIKVINYSLDFLNKLLKKVKENDKKSWKNALRILLVLGPLVATLWMGTSKLSNMLTTWGGIKLYFKNLLVSPKALEFRENLQTLGFGAAMVIAYIGSILATIVI